MAARCTKHSFEVAVAQCRSCSEPFCDDCLVFTYGPSSPPYCVPCALVAAGVRRVTGAEKKAMRAARGRKIELDPGARSQVTMTVGYDGAPVPPSPEVVEAQAAEAAEAAETAAASAPRVPVAWLAIAVGVLLLLVPIVAGNV